MFGSHFSVCSEALLYSSYTDADRHALQQHVLCVEDQSHLRSLLRSNGTCTSHTCLSRNTIYLFPSAVILLGLPQSQHCASLSNELHARFSGLVAFVRDGAVLPRRAGNSDQPLEHTQAVLFRSPPSLRRQITLPNAYLFFVTICCCAVWK